MKDGSEKNWNSLCSKIWLILSLFSICQKFLRRLCVIYQNYHIKLKPQQFRVFLGYVNSRLDSQAGLCGLKE